MEAARTPIPSVVVTTLGLVLGVLAIAIKLRIAQDLGPPWPAVAASVRPVPVDGLSPALMSPAVSARPHTDDWAARQLRPF